MLQLLNKYRCRQLENKSESNHPQTKVIVQGLIILFVITDLAAIQDGRYHRLLNNTSRMRPLYLIEKPENQFYAAGQFYVFRIIGVKIAVACGVRDGFI